MIRIGTSGWVYADWRGVFYPKGVPQKRWLEYYAEHFDTVELNATTYRLPSEAQIEAWCARVPSNFVYTVKLSRLITHRSTFSERFDTFIENFMTRMRCFAPGKVAQLLCQFPPALKRDDVYLIQFLDKLPREFRYVVEFRHPSWYVPEVEEILRERNLAFCIHDYPEIPTQDTVTSPDLAYIRFHGYTGLYSGSYPKNVLKLWAERITAISEHARDIFIYFNNDWHGAALKDAASLREMLGITIPSQHTMPTLWG